MSARVAVPRQLVVHARAHYRRTGCPQLFPAGPSACRLDAIAGARGRYLLVLDPERGRKLGILDDPDRDPMAGLMDAVAVALNLKPIRFLCDGRLVGRVEIIRSPLGTLAVRMCGHLSLTFLSWLLYEGGADFYLSLVKTSARPADNYTKGA